MLNLCIATLAVEQLENRCNFFKLLFFARKSLGIFAKQEKRRYMGRRTRAPCGGPAVGHWWCFHQGAPSTNEWIHVGAIDLDGTTTDHGSAPSGPGRCEDGEKNVEGVEVDGCCTGSCRFSRSVDFFKGHRWGWMNSKLKCERR